MRKLTSLDQGLTFLHGLPSGSSGSVDLLWFLEGAPLDEPPLLSPPSFEACPLPLEESTPALKRNYLVMTFLPQAVSAQQMSLLW